MYARCVPHPPIDHRYLRSALEFAVRMAEEGQKFKPPMKFPVGLKKFMKQPRIPSVALPAIRRMVEQDETFRSRIAVGALPELVDPIGKLWLERPVGWGASITELVAAAEAAEHAADAAGELKKSEKRREAAEQVAARTRAELVVLQEQLGHRDGQADDLRNDLAKLTESVLELRAELLDARTELRHARDREASATSRLARVESERAGAITAQGTAELVRDGVLADRAVLAAERSELARLAATAGSLAEQLAALASPTQSGKPRPQAKRKALPLPGGVMGDSDAATEYLLRSGATVLVDGYNVAKTGWPSLDLEGQRVVLLDVIENLARRFGSDITVVFDGADVVGASADRRRVARVVYSPAGVIADDVIRDEVRRLPVNRPVVVVTNDQEIIRDVRALGANTITTQQLLTLAR
jgi:hypothetical protein